MAEASPVLGVRSTEQRSAVSSLLDDTGSVDVLRTHSWAQTVAAEHGFTDVSHTVEVFGSCGPALNQPSAACSSVRACEADESTSSSIVPSASVSSPAPGNA